MERCGIGRLEWSSRIESLGTLRTFGRLRTQEQFESLGTLRTLRTFRTLRTLEWSSWIGIESQIERYLKSFIIILTQSLAK